MADMTVEAKRVKSGNALVSYETTATNAINQLKAIKAQLVALKATVNADPDYTVEDENVVQATINNLVAELATI